MQFIMISDNILILGTLIGSKVTLSLKKKTLMIVSEIMMILCPQMKEHVIMSIDVY